jgi:hypothetical protein
MMLSSLVRLGNTRGREYFGDLGLTESRLLGELSVSSDKKGRLPSHRALSAQLRLPGARIPADRGTHTGEREPYLFQPRIDWRGGASEVE